MPIATDSMSWVENQGPGYQPWSVLILCRWSMICSAQVMSQRHAPVKDAEFCLSSC